MSEEYIDTIKGYLQAELWHVDAYVPMSFDNNFHAPVSGKASLEQLKDALINFTNIDGEYTYIRGDSCTFKIDKDNHGFCILTYKGTSRHNVSTSVTLSEAGRLRLIEILEAGIAQAFTPEQIAERERHSKEWEAARDARQKKSGFKFW